MSKLIVEMEMPKSCPCDLIGVGYAMWCSAASGIPERVAEYDECVKNGTRPDWCPIKGVLPEEHGDLVDRDKLKNNLWCEHAYYYNRTDAAIAVQACIADVETSKAIIAAERKDDEQIH